MWTQNEFVPSCKIITVVFSEYMRMMEAEQETGESLLVKPRREAVPVWWERQKLHPVPLPLWNKSVKMLAKGQTTLSPPGHVKTCYSVDKKGREKFLYP